MTDRHASLLDLDPDLGELMDDARHAAARHALIAVVHPLKPGPWDVERLRADGIPAVISGAGPTVMALADADTADKVEQLAGSDWAANRLSLDSQGASVLPLAG